MAMHGQPDEPGLALAFAAVAMVDMSSISEADSSAEHAVASSLPKHFFPVQAHLDNAEQLDSDSWFTHAVAWLELVKLSSPPQVA
jgi:alpha-ketoglutarate-dependent taurine dioxygenase